MLLMQDVSNEDTMLLSISKNSFQSIKLVLEYVLESEESDYQEQLVMNGVDVLENHVWYRANVVFNEMFPDSCNEQIILQ